jgi:phage terminase large subunit GpA-like protein
MQFRRASWVQGRDATISWKDCVMTIAQLLSDVAAELESAQAKHGPMSSGHEGYAVILEELDELWEEVRKRKPDSALMRAEAIQVAAMALRFVLDVCPVKP